MLERIAILFVPAFNTDGHERFGRWNRPNQNGPEQTGWRTTSQNVNLNRDYTKADAPEMRAMLRLIDEFDPLVCADLHVTDGADFERPKDLDGSKTRIGRMPRPRGSAAPRAALDYASSWREPARAGGATVGRNTAAAARMIDFRGYAYTRTPSAISGELVTVYDPRTPQIWRVPLRDQVEASVITKAPRGGYLVPVPFAAEIAPPARGPRHRFRAAAGGQGKDPGRAVSCRSSRFLDDPPSRGEMRAALEGAWRKDTTSILPGAPLCSHYPALARLVLALFEPPRALTHSQPGDSSTPASSRRKTWSPT